ncbi:4-coumarate--CoA ligase [Desulfovibrio aerotolerans]|uniref:4-coumarate--CoA ligase n=1 Tax=Solidesulfovibrio aerotolerans TaxID=295255 RepID=A0A7C9N3S2_9BACT|nr:4-coumarate--CoA ligase [Solidesulfovibrio aerotolerans]MYL84811.1 4-coumarate--CoA ligase [Solidesulfovibrio aerotolerans]
MIPTRRGILRMLMSLARTLEQHAFNTEPERLAARAVALFGLEELPTINASCESKPLANQLDILASDIQDRWPGESLVFRTSGSTGVPKDCVQSLTLLVQEARFLVGLFRDSRRIVGLVPAHHIYGFLFSVLLPELLDVPVTDLDALSLGSLSNLLQPRDVVISFPLLWKKMGELSIIYPSGVTGVTSTGPCPENVIIKALESGLNHMTEIHGSTETGGLGYRLDHTQPYCLMNHWIRCNEFGLRRLLPSGEAPVPFDFPDMLAWEGVRFYRPVGRKDKAIQVAGVNVFPQHVRRVLLEHPLVTDAVVRPMRPEEGDRLKAFIVPVNAAPSSDVVIQILREYLKNRLTPPEIPRIFTFGEKIPQNDFGKNTDWFFTTTHRIE